MELKRDPLVTEAAGWSVTKTTQSAPESEPSDAATPDAVLASKQIAAAVNFAVEALSEELRQAITMREIEGLSYEEIAAADELPDRHRPVANLPRPRGDRSALCGPAGHAEGERW